MDRHFPPLPTTHEELTVDGFTLGHGSDFAGMTGVTVILCPEGALAAAEVRGSATSTRQFDSLVAAHPLATRAHGVVLAGGSAFGLAAADAVAEYLAAAGKGFETGFGVVPLVPTAILFDLAFGERQARPRRPLAKQALAAAAAGPVAMGSVGAGTGATVGKALGPERAMKGGFGFASLTAPGGVTVAAAVAVNAYGDVVVPTTGRTLAGCRLAPGSRQLADARRVLADLPPETRHAWEGRVEPPPGGAAAGAAGERDGGGGNTTLAVVMTDAELSRGALLKVCQMAFGGFYRALAPALSLYDGDLVVALARGRHPAHPHQVGVLAEEAVARAIVAGVERADGFGRLPAVRDLALGREGPGRD
jgi:L-aminopeptidase/D-esterase-like protein